MRIVLDDRVRTGGQRGMSDVDAALGVEGAIAAHRAGLLFLGACLRVRTVSSAPGSASSRLPICRANGVATARCPSITGVASVTTRRPDCSSGPSRPNAFWTSGNRVAPGRKGGLRTTLPIVVSVAMTGVSSVIVNSTTVWAADSTAASGRAPAVRTGGDPGASSVSPWYVLVQQVGKPATMPIGAPDHQGAPPCAAPPVRPDMVDKAHPGQQQQFGRPRKFGADIKTGQGERPTGLESYRRPSSLPEAQHVRKGGAGIPIQGHSGASHHQRTA